MSIYKHCPKCGGTSASGPHYRNDSLRGEHLLYVCLTCGYETREPTAGKHLDAPPERKPAT